MTSIDRGIFIKRTGRKARIAGIAVVMLMAMASIAVMSSPSPSGDGGEGSHARIFPLTPHAAISIFGDAGFLGANASTGIVWGSGTQSDPYIIAGWDIDASSNHGIYITGTTKHFVIRDCNIHDGMPIGYSGVYLNDVLNATMTNNTFANNWNAMVVIDGSRVTVTENNATVGNRYGLYAAGSSGWASNYSIENNTFSNCTNQGILLDTVRNGRIANNTCTSNGYRSIDLDTCKYFYIVDNNASYNDWSGILLGTCDHCQVLRNFVDWNEEYGVYLSWSENNTVDGNSISHNDLMGVFLQSSSHCNAVTNNTINDNVHGGSYKYGLHFESSNLNLVRNNTINGNDYGVTMNDGHGNMIYNNTIDSNAVYGVYLSWSDNNYNEIMGNHIEDNVDSGVCLSWGHYNRVWNNTFVDNNGAGAIYNAANAQAYDGDTFNYWNTSGVPHGYGNNWSDWWIPDLDSNGIVDNSYVLEGGWNQDNYPLTSPALIPEPSVVALAGLMIVAFLGIARLKKKL